MHTLPVVHTRNVVKVIYRKKMKIRDREKDPRREREERRGV